MDITLIDRLRPFLSKMIAAAVVPALAWVAAKTGYADFADERFAEIIAGAVLWLVLTLTHTAVSKKTNPGNTASAHLAKAQTITKAEIMAAQEIPQLVAAAPVRVPKRRRSQEGE